MSCRRAAGSCVGVARRKGWNSDDDPKVYDDESALRKTVSAAGFLAGGAFHAPLMRSELLLRNLCQYCVYQVYLKTER